MLRVVDAATFAAALPMGAAIDALAAAFRASALPQAPQRSIMLTVAGDVLSMPAADGEGAGVKLVTVAPANPSRGLPLIHAVYVLFDGATLAPRALLDGAALTATRTGAVSGVAAKHLAPPDAATLVVFGAGIQARAHIEAMLTVRPIERVIVVGRTPERAEGLAAGVRARGVDARLGVPDDVAGADIVCTCTTSRSPLFDGRLPRPGTFIAAVGAYEPDAREVDDATIERATVIVETRAAAMAEAGDLIQPIRSAVLDPEAVLELGEVLATPARPRDDLTLFKSVGIASEDLIVARAAMSALEATH